jgi:cytochrome P450
MHHDEDYWPGSFKFDPDRWTNPANAKHLEKAYVPFSKGSRMCIGIK